MDRIEILKEIKEYLECDEVQDQLNKLEEIVYINYAHLAKNKPDIAEELINNSVEIINYFESIFISAGFANKKVVIKNLYLEECNIRIKNIRNEHADKLIVIEGRLRQVGEVIPMITSIKNECESCGNIITILQDNTGNLKVAKRCGCGRKGNFKILSEERIDVQSLVVEEDLDDMTGNEQPAKINVLLKERLTAPVNSQKFNYGGRVKIIGFVKLIPKLNRQGGESTKKQIVFEAMDVESKEQTFKDLNISKIDIKKIKELSKDPNIMNVLIKSFAPHVIGNENLKKGVILQQFGGVKKLDYEGKLLKRGTTNVCIVGEPSTAKSEIARYTIKINPITEYSVGASGSSAAGLTAGVIRDEFSGGFAIEPGGMVMANGGTLIADELDKMSKADREALHECMTLNQITIKKIIKATLKAETNLLAIANPKYSRFDKHQNLAQQIAMPFSLLSRFDLIFLVRDMSNETDDRKIMKGILDTHRSQESIKPLIEPELFMKYLVYAKTYCNPKITEETSKYLEDIYINLRKKVGDDSPIPFSPRQGEGLIRLSEACAKVRLGNTVEPRDVDVAKELLLFSMKQSMFDTEAGMLDVDMLEIGKSHSQSNKIKSVLRIMMDLKSKFKDTIPIEIIVEKCGELGIEEYEFDKVIIDLKREGEIFEPRRGKLKIVE